MVDTDVLVDVARGRDDVADYLHQCESQRRLATSVVSRMELIVGCRSKRELQALDQFLRHYDVVGLTEAVGDLAVGLLVRHRLSRGLLIPDALIAATAISGGFALLTRNTRHYHFVEAVELAPHPWTPSGA